MRLPRFKRQFLARIVYKSGYTHDFWCWNFSIKNGVNYSWESVHETNKPLQLGADEIAAVYQIGHRLRLTTRK